MAPYLGQSRAPRSSANEKKGSTLPMTRQLAKGAYASDVNVSERHTLRFASSRSRAQQNIQSYRYINMI